MANKNNHQRDAILGVLFCKIKIKLKPFENGLFLCAVICSTYGLYKNHTTLKVVRHVACHVVRHVTNQEYIYLFLYLYIIAIIIYLYIII